MELFQLNRLYIIESLYDKLHTGDILYNALCKEKKAGRFSRFVIEFHDLNNIDDWNAFVSKVKNDIITNHVYPIIDLEIHGDKGNKGYILKNDDLLQWDKLFHDFQEINITCKNYLMLTLGICRGMNISQFIRINSRSPFLVAVGSFFELLNTEFLYSFGTFYEEFLETYDLKKAMDNLYNINKVPLETRLKFTSINTVDLFRNVYIGYLKNECSPEGIDRRRKETYKEFLIKEHKLDNRKIRRWYKNHFKKLLIKTKNKEYRLSLKSFFMLDKYPENEGRFHLPKDVNDFNKLYLR